MRGSPWITARKKKDTLILFGVGGMIRPTTTAMLHNISTVGISLQSMQNLPELKKV